MEREKEGTIRAGVQSSLDNLLTMETQVQQELARGYHGNSGAKGHRAIAKSKVNPDFKRQNLKQQAGFHAEVNLVTDQNVQAIRQKSKVRAYRTDELGQVNNPMTDLVWINEVTGERIPGSNVQVKFRGNTGAENVKQLLSKREFHKYHEQWLAIPTEQLVEAHQYLDQRIHNYNQQIERLKSRGELDKLQRVLEKKQAAESVQSRLLDGGSAKKRWIID